MLDYQTWSDIATGVPVGTALLLLLLSENQIPGQGRVFTLPARTIGGLGLCCLSASVVLPPLISPSISIEGRVADFREVTSLDGPSHFEFKLNSNGQFSRVLRAHYFDKGFLLRRFRVIRR
jgi:hypothetical protein